MLDCRTARLAALHDAIGDVCPLCRDGLLPLRSAENHYRHGKGYCPASKIRERLEREFVDNKDLDQKGGA